MAELQRVGSRAELGRSGALAVQVHDQHLAIFLVEGRVVATAGKCPHNGGPLHKGTVCAGKLSCPWHGWTYDLATGECEESDEASLARFEVRVENDDIYVML
jgi:nitrite reductase (NADH) small subunit